MRKYLILLLSILTLSGLNACTTGSPVLKPFKMDIQQGNVVTSKMLLQLRPGMTKSQVRFIMGTPLVVDSFHKDRWDYFYQLRQAGKVVEQRRVILDFDKELLSKVRGDVVPQGTAGAVSGEIPVSKSIKTAKEETGLLDQLKFWKKEDKKDEKTPVLAAAPTTPAVTTPKAEEKGLLEKLKFWKKDESAAKTIANKPIEAPQAVLPVPTATQSANDTVMPDIAPEEAVSVLAVPIEIGASLPSVELPSAKTPEVKVTPIAMPTVETPKVEPVKALPSKIETVKVEAAKVTPSKIAAPAPPPNKPVQPIAKTKQDEKMIFRLDRTLKTELLTQEALPATVAPAIEKAVIEKPAAQSSAKPTPKTGEAPLPAEAEPSFFDKMLEKIGF